MKWFRRALIATVIVLIALEVGVNVVLAGSMGKRLMNLSPDDVRIDYRAARMWVPFLVDVDDLVLSVQDPAIQMQITAKHARALFHPLAVARLQIAISDIDGDDVTFRMRQRVIDGQLSEDELKRLPVIDAFPSPIRVGPPVFPPKLPFIDLQRMNITNVREVWVDSIHYQGRADVTGGFALQPLDSLALSQTTVVIDPGSLVFGEDATPLQVGPTKLEAALDTVRFAELSLETLKKLTLKAKVEVGVRNASLINDYLKDVPSVRVVDGAGTLRVHATLDRGVLSDDSSIALETDRLAVNVPSLVASGRAVISGRIQNKRPLLELEMHKVGLEHRAAQTTVLEAERFDLMAVSSSSDLTKPQALDLTLDLSEVRAPDLSFLNLYIPTGSGLRIVSGRGVLGGLVSVSTSTNHAHGKLEIGADRLEVRTRGATLTGRGEIHGVFKDVDLKTGSIDIAGSNFALKEVDVTTGLRRSSGFWLTLAAPEARFRAPDRWDSKLEVRFSNLQPLIAIVAAMVQLPDVVTAIANVPNVSINTDLLVDDRKVTLGNVKVESSGGLSGRGTVVLREVGKPPDSQLEPWGPVLVKLNPLAVGLDLQGQTVKPVLIDAEGWFKRTTGT